MVSGTTKTRHSPLTFSKYPSPSVHIRKIAHAQSSSLHLYQIIDTYPWICQFSYLWSALPPATRHGIGICDDIIQMFGGDDIFDGIGLITHIGGRIRRISLGKWTAFDRIDWRECMKCWH